MLIPAMEGNQGEADQQPGNPRFRRLRLPVSEAVAAPGETDDLRRRKVAAPADRNVCSTPEILERPFRAGSLTGDEPAEIPPPALAFGYPFPSTRGSG
jgi:hypothetical protein